MGLGGLYHGGFQRVGNLKYLHAHNIVAVVNTAKGLGDFFPQVPEVFSVRKENQARELSQLLTRTVDEVLPIEAKALEWRGVLAVEDAQRVFAEARRRHSRDG